MGGWWGKRMDGCRWSASQTSSNAHRWRDRCQLLGQVSWWNQRGGEERERVDDKRGGGRLLSTTQSINQSITEPNERRGDKRHSKQVLVEVVCELRAVHKDGGEKKSFSQSLADF